MTTWWAYFKFEFITQFVSNDFTAYCRLQTCCCPSVWRARSHCRFLDWRNVRTKSEVQQRCDDRKWTTSAVHDIAKTETNLPQIYWSKTSVAMHVAWQRRPHCRSNKHVGTYRHMPRRIDYEWYRPILASIELYGPIAQTAVGRGHAADDGMREGVKIARVVSTSDGSLEIATAPLSHAIDP